MSLVPFSCYNAGCFKVLGLLSLVGSILMAGTSVSDTPRRGGILRVATEYDPRMLDPPLLYSDHEGMLAWLLFTPLLDIDSNGKLRPMLAETLPVVSPDGLVYTFRLRPGVRFSNGRELVADDVVFTLERHLESGYAGGFAENIRGQKAFQKARQEELASRPNAIITSWRRWIEPITAEGLRALDHRTVQILLNKPDLALAHYLASPFTSVVPRAEVEQWGSGFGTHPVGTGPFVLKEWTRGVRLRFERNPYYFHAGWPCLDGVDVLVNVDWTIQAMMFERSELDCMPNIAYPDFVRLRKSGQLHGFLETLTGTSPVFIALNCEMAPFTNHLVRLAMNYAVDKETITKKLHYRGFPVPGVTPMNVKGFNPGLAGYPYDPFKAKLLMSEAGFGNGFSTTLWVSHGNSTYQTIAFSVQQDLKEVGVNVLIKEVSHAAILEIGQQRKRVTMQTAGWVATINDPKDALDSLLNGDSITDQGCMNTAFYTNADVQTLFRAASIELDPDRRIQLYQQIEKLIIRDAPWIFLCQMNTDILRQPWLKGLRLQGIWPPVRLEGCWIER